MNERESSEYCISQPCKWEGKLEIYTYGASVNEKESSEYCISQQCKWEGKLGIYGTPVNKRESSGKMCYPINERERMD